MHCINVKRVRTNENHIDMNLFGRLNDTLCLFNAHTETIDVSRDNSQSSKIECPECDTHRIIFCVYVVLGERYKAKQTIRFIRRPKCRYIYICMYTLTLDCMYRLCVLLLLLLLLLLLPQCFCSSMLFHIPKVTQLDSVFRG